MILYIIEASILLVFTIGLVWYFCHHSTPYYVRFIVVISLQLSFLCFMILPIDIYETTQKSELSSHIYTIWVIIYDINFVLCWLLLPIIQEFQDSGEFTPLSKFKDALKMNAILIGLICTGAIILVIYEVIFNKFTISQLPSLFAMIVNIFGLTLVSIMLGFGLISFPKQCYLKSDYKKRVNRCHRMAQMLKSQQQQIMEEVYQIKNILHSRSQTDEETLILTLIQQNFDFNGFHSYADQNQKLQQKSNASLHGIIKKQTLSYNSCESQLDELVDELKSVTEHFSKNNYSYKKVLYIVLFVFTTITSLVIFWAQICSFLPFLSGVNLLSLIQWDNPVSYIMNCLLTLYIVYIVSQTVFRIKIYRIFALHKKHSTASSLVFTSINLARIAYPLCYNYLQITSMPDSAFLQFFGEINFDKKYAIIFPILMIIFGVFNLFDIYDKIMGYLGLGSYAFDEQEAQEKSEEGQRILVEKLKSRNIENHRMEMIQLL